MRVVVVLYVFPWPLIALGTGLPARLHPWLAGVTAVAVVGWLLLLRARSLSHGVLVPITGAAAVVAGGLAATAPWSGAAVAYELLLLVVCLTAAIFLRGRFLAAHLAVVGAVLTAGLVAGSGAGTGLLVSGAFVLTVLSLELLVVVLGHAARRQDVVDHMTGLPNGHGLGATWSGRLAGRAGVVAVVAISGLDDARQALGWETTTALLHRAIEDIGQVLPDGAVIGRIEGDELVVATSAGNRDTTPGMTDATALATTMEAARALAGTLTGAIGAGRYLVNRIEVGLRAHVGLALTPWDGVDFAELVRLASLSASRAVRNGDDHCIWDGDQSALTVDDLALLADLRLAPERGELWLAYQLQVDAATKRPVGVEALVRWQSRSRGSVPPTDFIGLAEQTGLIQRLTEWVLGAALDAQLRWRRAGLQLPVAVNLSAKLLTRSDLSDWILGELAARSLPPEVLTVEVTETAATVDLSQAVSLLQPLHDHGVRVSIDDFGSGYTSLASLPHLPLDELKVDAAFVQRLAVSAADEAIVLSIGDLARRLGVQSVAEGVEDQRTADRLSDHGFDVIQGFLYARPVTEAALLDRIGRDPHQALPPEQVASTTRVARR